MAEKGEHSGAKEVQLLPKPKISLSDLNFLIYVKTKTMMTTLVTRGKKLEFGSNDRFHIQVENLSHQPHLGLCKSSMADVNIKCEVVYKDDWRLEDDDDDLPIFDARRSNSGWLNNDLVIPKGYNIVSGRGLAADIKLSFNGDLLDKIGFQIFHQADGNYFSLNDTLRYLQCFFPV